MIISVETLDISGVGCQNRKSIDKPSLYHESQPCLCMELFFFRPDDTMESLNETMTTYFFDDYVEDSLDPGWALVIGSLVACILLHATLPCMITLGSRYERQKTSKLTDGGNISTDEDDTSDEGVKAQTSSRNKNCPQRQPSILLEKMRSNPTMESQRSNIMPASATKGKTTLTAIEEEVSVNGEQDLRTSQHRDQPHLHTTTTSVPPCFGDGLVAIFCGVAETIDNNALLSLPRSRRNSRRNDASSVSSTSTTQPRTKQARRQNTTNDAPGESDASQASTISRTVLSKLHHDDVSFTEALDKYHPPTVQYQRKEKKQGDSGEIDIFCGERAWWKPKVIGSALDKLVEISDIDGEMMALIRTALPISTLGFANGFFNLLDVSLIGYLVGVEEASVFVMVSILTWLPTSFGYGIFESLTKFVPAAVDQDQPQLAGTYLNTAIALFTLMMIPIGLFWSFLTTATFLRLGFDSSTAALAQQYAFVQVGVEWISGIGYCVHLFLDVTGHERYSTYSNLVFGFLQSLAVVVQSLLGGNSLVNIGLCRAMFAALHVLGSLSLVMCWGWFDKYRTRTRHFPFTVSIRLSSITIPLYAIAFSCSLIVLFPHAKKTSDLKEMIRTAATLGVVYFFSYGEWELLTLFASALGPAEIVAWAMLGRLWSILTYMSDGLADAAESRSVLHFVSNDPDMARSSAGKSQFLGFFSSLLVTSILFILGMELSKAICPDPMLQRLMVEIFPLLGLGAVIQTTGLISVSLLGAQERAGMATLIQLLGNWCITMILGSVFTFGFRIDLQGLASAVVLGLGLSSTGNSFLLLRSQWNSIAIRMSRGLMDEPQLQNERNDDGPSTRQSIV
jgi:Na+-driven multidrug efflux pump